MMSGSGLKAGGAPGEKSRGGSVITERGVPSAAFTSAACASVGTVAAAPASIRRRLSFVMAISPYSCLCRALKRRVALSITAHDMDGLEAAQDHPFGVEGNVA